MQALEGKYTEPGPGGDPIRNPGVLPTGKVRRGVLEGTCGRGWLCCLQKSIGGLRHG